MDDKDWMILKRLAEEHNLTRAAERLYMSQPALTYRIQQMEKELDIQILQRGRRGVEFTSQGEAVVKYAKDMLVRWHRMKEQLQTMEAKVAGTLRLGVSNTLAAYKLPTILKPFLRQYPEVDVKVTTHWSSELIPSIFSQDMHVGFIRGDYAWHGERHLLFEEHLCLVSQEPMDLAELPHRPRINFKTDASLQAGIDLWWKEHYSKPPSVAMEVDSMETGKKMVQNGLGYAIMPSIVLEDASDLVQQRLVTRTGEPVTRRSWMIYGKEALHSLLVETFVTYVQGLSLGIVEEKL